MILRSIMGVLATVGLVAGCIGSATAADQAKPLPGNNWQSIAKDLPDWGGLWEVTFGGGGGRSRATPMLTPKYQAILDDYRAKQKSGAIQDSPAANCVPPGMPGIMGEPYPIEILFTPGKVTVISEAYEQWRQIFTDGRSHPDDPDPTYNGHSIGHWEGDTLVADTVGFVSTTPLGDYATQHSDKMHIVERMHTTGPDTLEIETTITDPEALVEPFVMKRVYGRHRDWTLAEYICQQNNRNSVDENGQAAIDLTQ
jgi:hypothetical protein